MKWKEEEEVETDKKKSIPKSIVFINVMSSNFEGFWVLYLRYIHFSLCTVFRLFFGCYVLLNLPFMKWENDSICCYIISGPYALLPRKEKKNLFSCKKKENAMRANQSQENLLELKIYFFFLLSIRTCNGGGYCLFYFLKR